MWWWTTGCPSPSTTSCASPAPATPPSFGQHSWRRPMPSEFVTGGLTRAFNCACASVFHSRRLQLYNFFCLTSTLFTITYKILLSCFVSTRSFKQFTCCHNSSCGFLLRNLVSCASLGYTFNTARDEEKVWHSRRVWIYAITASYLVRPQPRI